MNSHQPPVELGYTLDYMDVINISADQNKIFNKQLKSLKENGASTDANGFTYNSDIEKKSQTYKQNEKLNIISNEHSSKISNQQNITTTTNNNRYSRIVNRTNDRN